MSDKKKWLIMLGVLAAVVIALTVVLLTLSKTPVAPPASGPTSAPSASTVDTSLPIFGERVTFTATVLNVRKGAILVHANGGLCWVRTSVKDDEPVPTLHIGDGVQVVYNGMIAESYPGQINFVYQIRKLDKASSVLTYVLEPTYDTTKSLTQVADMCDLGGAVYLYGIKELDVTVDGQTDDLQRALAIGLVSPEYLLKQAEADAIAGKCQSDQYRDGGSILYRYKEFALLKMNTLSGDKTLYIGTTDLTPNVI